jgi:hypothetical protein
LGQKLKPPEVIKTKAAVEGIAAATTEIIGTFQAIILMVGQLFEFFMSLKHCYY